MRVKPIIIITSAFLFSFLIGFANTYADLTPDSYHDKKMQRRIYEERLKRIKDHKAKQNKDEPSPTEAQTTDEESNLSEDKKKELKSKGVTDEEIQELENRGVTDNMLNQAQKLASIAHNLNGAPKLQDAFGGYYHKIFDDFAFSSEESLKQKAINIPVDTAQKIPGTIFTAKNKSDLDTSSKAFTAMNTGNNEIYVKMGNNSVVALPSQFYLPTKNSRVNVKAWILK